MEPAVKTTCPYCGVGCGVIAKTAADGGLTVQGDPDHPANFGRLCSKGSALAETVDLDGRLLHPEVHGKRVDWNTALDLVAETFSRTIATHGPDSVALYLSGQLLTEDYYVANKLMKGFIGSANVDTNSRLCMASSVAGHKRAFGADVVPGTYADLEQADLVVLVGSNLAWCHPVLYRRLAAAKAERPGMRVVLVDPRRTMTADLADLHLPIRADADIPLFTGLLAWLADHEAIDRHYVEAHTSGLDEALAAARSADLDEIAALTGLPHESIEDFYRLFTETERVVTAYSQGVNQSTQGTDKVGAIINCHLATGRIGRPGMGPFSVTGQPNAMGGREVGGLANTLAAHMEIERSDHRERMQRFWRSPMVAAQPGLKAVDMFRAVADGRIKALWIMATNPVDSLPQGRVIEDALKACPFVVVSDVLASTDTVRHAHVRLPAAAWGEKDGTVTNSERRVSRQRAFLPLPGEARPDWRIIRDVAARMGFARAFGYTSPFEIFAEHAALSAFENDGTRAFDMGHYADVDAPAFDRMEPFQWPRRHGASAAETRFFDNGGFFTPDRKGRFIAVRPAGVRRTGAERPFILNTGRIRDQWHTMTRTGKSQRLSQHLAEPYAEIHPLDARRLGIADADVVRVSAGEEGVLVRALLSARQSPGSIFVPMHWTDQYAASARINRLVHSLTDPISGQPASKHVPVAVEVFAAARHGFAVLRGRPSVLDAAYWALARCQDGWRVELAEDDADADGLNLARSLFGCAEGADILAYHDADAGQQRFAWFEGDRLMGALFLAPGPVAVSRAWAIDQLAASFELRNERLAVLAGRPHRGVPDRGATVCACFGVGANDIAAAVAAGCRTVAAVGQALQAGTNCGSCRAEIKGIINAHSLEAAE
ncbi:nitrate reductase [Marinivivus vitaminiproducens]|uniref:nitrate reductase n=1 Tax=Marinivivus vitaminiproducens TaxID=3035935 RepID=UPI0027A0D570|nr:molybdopterin-dependent oxidoreductase [Geminicoccaceae bacterium SCSIO 64248]